MSFREGNVPLWLKLAVLVVVFVPFVAGCGSPVVHPGNSTRSTPMMIPAGQPGALNNVAESGAIESVGNLPRVPAAQVVTLPEREPEQFYHTVKQGETLTGIASQYGQTSEGLIEANGLDRSSVIEPGQLIYIPR